jgi:hypothetical protein
MKGTCQKPGCGTPAMAACDPCGQNFCSDHGSINQFTSACHDAAVCWHCGGFDADA